MNRLVVYFIVALLVVSMGWLLSRSLFNIETQAVEQVVGKEGWVPYNSPSKLWSIGFPKEPKFSTFIFRDELGLPEVALEGADAESDGDVYFVRLYHYHMLPPEDVKDFLEDALIAWKKKFPALTLVGTQKSTFKGKESLNFHLLGQNLEMDGMALKSGSDFYLIGFIGEGSAGKKNQENFQTFLNSFNFIVP